MRQVHHIGGKPPNPLLQLLGFIAAAVVFVLSVLVGGILLAAFVGFVLIVMVIIYARLWWLRRKLNPDGTSGETVDVEYEVIDISDPNDMREEQK